MSALCEFVDEHGINVPHKHGIGVEGISITDVVVLLVWVWVWPRVWVRSDKLGDTTRVS
jgi:hypothetical protein